MGHTNRRADGDGLSSEPHKWSAAGTYRNPRGSTARGFVEAIGIHFVCGMEDVNLNDNLLGISAKKSVKFTLRWSHFQPAHRLPYRVPMLPICFCQLYPAGIG